MDYVVFGEPTTVFSLPDSENGETHQQRERERQCVKKVLT
jgi:hypothetical protein